MTDQKPNPDPFEGLNLRQQLAALKGLNGWPGRVMAEAAGCHTGSLLNYLAEKSEMSLPKIERMLSTLGYEIRIVKKESA